MLKIILVSLAAIVLLAAAVAAEEGGDIASGEVDYENSYELEFPNLNETELEKGTQRYEPFLAWNEKLFSIVATAQVNWFAAHEICSFRGLTLASVNSAAEGENLRRYLFDNGLNAGKNYWLSGTDLASADNWSWFSNGRPLVFDNFVRTTTAAARFRSSYDDYVECDGAYRCMLLRPDGRWIKQCCTAKAYFICENRCPLDSYAVPLNNVPAGK